jgi:hypothetical protein
MIDIITWYFLHMHVFSDVITKLSCVVCEKCVLIKWCPTDRVS